MPPVGTRKIRSRGQKSRDGAPRGAASSKGDAHIRNGRAARCSIPSIFRGARKGDDGVPGAAKNTGDDACAAQSALSQKVYLKIYLKVACGRIWKRSRFGKSKARRLKCSAR